MVVTSYTPISYSDYLTGALRYGGHQLVKSGLEKSAAYLSSKGGAMVRNAGKKAYNAVASRVRGAFKGRSSGASRTTGYTTFQRDVNTRYVKRRMPRRKRVRWQRFTRKVKHVMLQMNQLRTYTDEAGFNQRHVIGVNNQVTGGIILGGTQATGCDELWQIFKQEYNLLTVDQAAAWKLFLKAMSLDVQMRNAGSTTLVVDVYEVAYRKSWDSVDNLAAIYNTCFDQQETIAGSKSSTDVATTPFQNPQFCSYYRIKNKREFVLAPGQVATMQMRKPHNRSIDGKRLFTEKHGIPGFTSGYLYQVRGVGNWNGSSVEYASGELIVTRQITVSYGPTPTKQREGTQQK